jgi:drug/metabolite transporter (DMT)-like permease
MTAESSILPEELEREREGCAEGAKIDLKNPPTANATLIGKGKFMSTSVSGLLPIAMIVIGGILYHVSQKSTPRGVDPFFSLMISFGLASLACLVIYFVRGGAAGQTKLVNWTAIGLALSVVGIESGYLIAYRSGFRINLTSLACNTAIAVALIFIGTMLYSERLAPRNIAGAVLCLIGLTLLR